MHVIPTLPFSKFTHLVNGSHPQVLDFSSPMTLSSRTSATSSHGHSLTLSLQISATSPYFFHSYPIFPLTLIVSPASVIFQPRYNK